MSDTIIEVENPATGEIAGRVPINSAEDVHEMAARARAAQREWSALGFDGRGEVLLRARGWLIDSLDRVVGSLVAETGKAQDEALIAEVPYVAQAFGFWARHAPKYLGEHRVRSRSPFMVGQRLSVRYSPLGLIGVIGPWNVPLMNSFGDCIPALAAGNAVIHKPSEITPLTAILMGECLRDCGLPEGCYQVATGYGETGAAVIDEVDYVMFTGSTATGKRIMARAAETLTGVSLELGGKDAMVVLADANVRAAAIGAVFGGLLNGGQTCISVERVYVEAPVYDEFVRLVVEETRTLRQGPPSALGAVDLGATIAPAQLQIVDAHVKDALAKGARALTGGARRPGPGYFYEPTVLVDVDHSMRCMTEETFGPTLPIVKVADADEAVRMANDCIFGLQASVWSGDRRRGPELAGRLEAGTVTVNSGPGPNYMALELPMGGWKQSGLGSRHGGADGIRKYAHKQSLLINKLPLRRMPYGMPYAARKTRAFRWLVERLYRRGA